MNSKHNVTSFDHRHAQLLRMERQARRMFQKKPVPSRIARHFFVVQLLDSHEESSWVRRRLAFGGRAA